MSAGLINHLKQKTEADSNTRILMSQWEFDEKLVGKSLENVGSYYPHFSSHNESHSKQILVNIERLLGSNINKLTATDTWLILEAAYWHDIGMLFSADEAKAVYEKAAFKDYVESLAMDNTQDLHDFAKVWHEQGWQKAMVSYIDPYTGVEKYRQMIAEWYRRGHAENSNDIVLDPFSKLNLNSPRTELLPKRIYRYLGAICWAHGRGFDYVMEHLPFRQTGMGTENCHPRFVACLLRLGDLFDIDDNRFCPVMKKQVSNIPAFSATHEEKHKAIREFQLDSETVSITAECSTEMAYIECRNWFNWIEEELQKQMSQWKNIVPHRDFGLLPTINKLDVQMEGKKILLNDKPMKFSLDERSAIELLQGNNLYKDDMSIYRELIQNAIDATMIRVWLEHGQKKSQEPLPSNANPYDENTRKIFEKYPIELDCRKIADNDDSTLWEFSIEDHGMGISRKDLEYMQKIAGSKNNKEKQKIIHQMPEWMRPSGEFGIGLHSAFLLMKDLPVDDQKIIITTKSIFTHETLKIELNSPLSGKSGYCFIEKIDDIKKYGTTIHIKQNISNTKNTNYENILQSVKYENIKNRDLLYLKKISSIKEYIYNPLIKINLSEILYILCEEKKEYEIDIKKYYWDKSNNTAISVNFHEDTDLSRTLIGARSRISFRGQHISNYFDNYKSSFKIPEILRLGSISLFLDIYSNNSSNIVSLNREEVINNNLLNEIIVDSYFNLVKEFKENKNNSLLNMLSNKKDLSFILNFNHIYLHLENDESWKNLKISRKYKISDIDKSKIIIYSQNTALSLDLLENISDIDKNLEIIKTNSNLFGLLAKQKQFHKYLLDNNFLRFIYNHGDKRIHTDLYTTEDISKYSSNYIRKDYNYEKSLYDSIDSIINACYSNPNYNYNILNEENIRKSFLNKEIKDRIIKIFKKEKINPIIIIPFYKEIDDIIEIPNEKIINGYDMSMESKNELSRIYDSIKEEILDYAKKERNDWYDRYLKGKSFKKIDLSYVEKGA